MSYESFKSIIWSKEVQLATSKLMVFRDICNTKFQGDVGKGKTVRVIGVGKPSVKTYIPGSPISAAETPTSTSMDLAINQYKYTNFLVDDVDAAQSNVDILRHLMKGSAEALAQAADSYIASLVLDAKEENILTKTAAINTAAAAKKAVDECFVKLWEEGVKTGTDTYVVVSPWFYSLFKDSLTQTLTDNVELVEKGILGLYNGAKVVMSNNIHRDTVGTGDSAVTYACLSVLTKDAIAYADGIEETNAYRPEDSFTDAVKILHTYGAKVVRPEQIVCLKVKNS